MSTDPTRLNGSVDALANALRDVVYEATAMAVEPVLDRLGTVETRLGTVETGMGAMETRMGAMESNVQAQLAQHRKDVASDVRSMFEERDE